VTLPYLGRFVCLAFSAFFLTHAVSGLLVWLVARRAVRSSVSYDPTLAARILFWLRLSPMALALLLLAALITPSYFLFEPTSVTEELSPLCLVTSLLGVTILAVGLFRGVAAIVRSASYLRAQQESDAPVILVAGLFHPRLVVSSDIRRLLTEEEYAAALRHEEAHRRAKDNLKRLLILMSPNFFPFCRRFQMIESGWQRLAEWAADDSAAQGSQVNALALASALIRVGRMNAACTAIRLGTSLLADTADLRTRVERLVEARQQYRRLPGKSLWAAAAAALAVVIAVSPNLLRAAHVFLEALAK
jgi:Zn-dependent protease with chaperone function